MGMVVGDVVVEESLEVVEWAVLEELGGMIGRAVAGRGRGVEWDATTQAGAGGGRRGRILMHGVGDLGRCERDAGDDDEMCLFRGGVGMGVDELHGIS